MIEKLQRRYALSEQGAKDLVKGCIACALQNISFMFPVSLLYILVTDLLNGMCERHTHIPLCDGLRSLCGTDPY